MELGRKRLQGALLVIILACWGCTPVLCTRTGAGVRGPQGQPISADTLARWAPQESVGVLAVDIRGVIGSAEVQGLLANGSELNARAKSLWSVAFFVLERPESEECAGSRWCGIVTAAEPWVSAYKADLQEAAAREGGECWGPLRDWGGAVLLAFPEESIVLLGADEVCLQSVAKAFRAGGTEPALDLTERVVERLRFGPGAYAVHLPGIWDASQTALSEGDPLALAQGMLTGELAVTGDGKIRVTAEVKWKEVGESPGVPSEAGPGLCPVLGEEIGDKGFMFWEMPPVAAWVRSTWQARGATRVTQTHCILTQVDVQSLVGAVRWPDAIFGSHPDLIWQHRESEFLYQICEALYEYADGHGGWFPADLETLLQQGYLDSGRFFIGPLTGKLTARGEMWYLWRELHTFEYAGAMPDRLPGSVIVACSPEGDFPFGGLRLVLRVHRAVDCVSEEELKGPGGLLARSYEAVSRALGEKMTAQREAELRRFYGMGSGQDP